MLQKILDHEWNLNLKIAKIIIEINTFAENSLCVAIAIEIHVKTENL